MINHPHSVVKPQKRHNHQEQENRGINAIIKAFHRYLLVGLDISLHNEDTACNLGIVGKVDLVLLEEFGLVGLLGSRLLKELERVLLLFQISEEELASVVDCFCGDSHGFVVFVLFGKFDVKVRNFRERTKY